MTKYKIILQDYNNIEIRMAINTRYSVNMPALQLEMKHECIPDSLRVYNKKMTYNNRAICNIKDKLNISIPIHREDEMLFLSYNMPKIVRIGYRSKQVIYYDADCFFALVEFLLLIPLMEDTKCVVEICFPKDFLESNETYYFYSIDELRERILFFPMKKREYFFGNVKYIVDLKASYDEQNVAYVIEKTRWLLEKMQKELDMPIERDYTIAICDSSVVQGGFSSQSGAIAELDLYVLFHEIVHFWIGGMIGFSNDALWIKEGITEFFTYKGLYECCYISKNKFKTIIKNKVSSLLELNKKGYESFKIIHDPLKLPDDEYTLTYDIGFIFFVLLGSELNHRVSIGELLSEIYTVEHGLINTETINYTLDRIDFGVVKRIENILFDKNAIDENLLINRIIHFFESIR